MEGTTEKIATEQYVLAGGKRLRCGFTTGSAAAMAAQAAAAALETGKFPEYSKITTLKGFAAVSEVLFPEISGGRARCAIRKDAGDDPDATDGILIWAAARFSGEPEQTEVEIRGGRGIGKVTKGGLDQKKGEWAINSVPRKMIFDAVKSALKKPRRVEIEIGAEGGEEIAKRTFNPMLGIKGGISILGTTGVVEPMSESALVEAIFLEMRVIREEMGAEGTRKTLVVTPGNYGEDFIKNCPELADCPTVRCSNFLGKAIDFAVELGFEKVVFVGHAGKFVKVAAGVMNTHSHVADCRMETLAAHAALTCADRLDRSDYARILGAATVDAALDVLDETDSAETVCRSVVRAAKRKIAERIARDGGRLTFDFIMFTNGRGILG